MGALKQVEGLKKVKVTADASIAASVDIVPIQQGFGIAVKLAISLSDLGKEVAKDLVDAAH